MIVVRIVQFVKIVQLVQLDYYGYIKFFGGFVGTWVGAFTIKMQSCESFRRLHFLSTILFYLALTVQILYLCHFQVIKKEPDTVCSTMLGSLFYKK